MKVFRLFIRRMSKARINKQFAAADPASHISGRSCSYDPIGITADH